MSDFNIGLPTPRKPEEYEEKPQLLLEPRPWIPWRPWKEPLPPVTEFTEYDGHVWRAVDVTNDRATNDARDTVDYPSGADSNGVIYSTQSGAESAESGSGFGLILGLTAASIAVYALAAATRTRTR